MKQLHGSARATAMASMDECLALISAVQRYPDWHPGVVRGVVLLEGGEEGVRAEVTLHVAHGPIVRDFDLLMAVTHESPSSMTLTRIARTTDDEEEFRVRWQLSPLDPTRTELKLELEASLAVPRLLPLGGIGDAFAASFVRAAVNALDPA
jgi:ribosome-associated toxin RatA of RatAB toxin-antitoxin module